MQKGRVRPEANESESARASNRFDATAVADTVQRPTIDTETNEQAAAKQTTAEEDVPACCKKGHEAETERAAEAEAVDQTIESLQSESASSDRALVEVLQASMLDWRQLALLSVIGLGYVASQHLLCTRRRVTNPREAEELHWQHGSQN